VTPGPEAIDALAREYVLGTLAGGARRRFETLLRRSPEAARAVARWQERTAHLAAGVPPLAPSAGLWRGLEARLFAPAQRPARRPWWGWLGAATVGALVCAVVLRAALPAFDDAPGDLPAAYVGLLTDAQGQPVVLAGATRHGTRLSVKLLRPLAPPAGAVARLWALPALGAPLPLGVVPAGGKATLTLPTSAEALLSQVPRLGITFEPDTASATPRGPFVVSGHCVKMW
jgi:anti-sigma-K factor RskA